MAKRKAKRVKEKPKKRYTLDAFLGGVAATLVLSGILYLGNMIYTQEWAYQPGECYANSENSDYHIIYSKVLINIVGEDIKYKYVSKKFWESFKKETKWRTYDSFSDIYKEEVNCSLYQSLLLEMEVDKLDSRLKKLETKNKVK